MADTTDGQSRLRVLSRFRDDALRFQFGANLTHSELIAALLQHQQDKRDEALRAEFGPGWETADHDSLITEFMRRTAEQAGELAVRATDEEEGW